MINSGCFGTTSYVIVSAKITSFEIVGAGVVEGALGVFGDMHGVVLLGDATEASCVVD